MSEIILDLCGGTGAWSKPYQDAGYDVRVVTLPDDVRLYYPPDNVHGVLSAPPCTNLAGSGARWWKEKGQSALLESLSIVDACIRIITISKPKWWCLENPVGRLVHYLGKPLMYFHPYEYGNLYQKKTCLWGNFTIPVKTPVENTEGMTIWRNYGGKSERTKMMRSITPDGFAKAFFKANP